MVNEDGAAADDSDRQRCSCLPFCFWGASRRRPNNSGGPQAKRRRRRRLRFKLVKLSSWLAWPWLRKTAGNGDAGDGSSEKGIKKRRKGGRRLLLLLTTSLQPKKALASVVSGDSSALLPVPVPAAKVRRLILIRSISMVETVKVDRLIARVMCVISIDGDHDYSPRTYAACSIDRYRLCAY